MKKKRKWLKWIVLLIVILAAAAVLLLTRKTQSVEYAEVTVTKGTLTTYYNFDGLVHAPVMQTLTAAQNDTVRTVYVSQNQRVKKGDRLYRLDGGETVKAEIDGEVTGLFICEDSVLQQGQTTAEIIDMNRLEVHLDVDEYDVYAVRPGSAVSMTVLSGGVQLDGEVSALNKNGTASGDLSYYTAMVPVEADADIYPGMQVSAKVLRDHVEDAVLLRLEAVQFDEYNKPFVQMRGADGAVISVPITVGVSDGVCCEILEGLTEGDIVLKQSGMSMQEFMEFAMDNHPLLQ